MIRRTLRSLAIAATLLLFAATAEAQSRSQSDDDHPLFSVGLSPLGWTPTPSTYLFGFDGYFHFNRNWSLGSQLQIGAKTGDPLIGWTVSGRYHMDVFSGTKLAKARPFVQGGIGLGHLTTTEFLFNTGVGVDIPVNDLIVVGSNMLFNISPGATPAFGSGFVFSWQVVHVRFQF